MNGTLLTSQRAGKAEPPVVVAILGVIVVTVGAPTIITVIDPATATHNAVLANSGLFPKNTSPQITPLSYDKYCLFSNVLSYWSKTEYTSPLQ